MYTLTLTKEEVYAVAFGLDTLMRTYDCPESTGSASIKVREALGGE